MCALAGATTATSPGGNAQSRGTSGWHAGRGVHVLAEVKESACRAGGSRAPARRVASGAPVEQWHGHIAVPPGSKGGAPGVRRAYTRNWRRASMEDDPGQNALHTRPSGSSP
jgi:hypothetical protein